MSLFTPKVEADQAVPDSRITVFADMEFADFLKESPITIDKAPDVDWAISRDDDKIYATGSITLPLKMIFKEGNLKNDSVLDDLVLIDIEVDGKSQLGIKFEKPKKKELKTTSSVEAMLERVRE